MARLTLVLALLLISGCQQWYYTEKGERRLDYLDPCIVRAKYPYR